MQTVEELLRSSQWGQGLSDDEMAMAIAGTSERRIAAGGFVCMKGEPVDHWMGVVDGLVKMASHWSTGKTTSLAGIPTGGWFGEGSLLKDEVRRYDVIAIRDSRIAYMKRSTFRWLLDHSIPFNRFLVTQINERLGQFIAMIENERLLETDARIARCLAGLFNPILGPGAQRQVEISQEELGYLAGISRQRVNQSLKLLEDQGLLKIEYGRIHVLDVAGLARFGD